MFPLAGVRLLDVSVPSGRLLLGYHVSRTSRFKVMGVTGFTPTQRAGARATVLQPGVPEHSEGLYP